MRGNETRRKGKEGKKCKREIKTREPKGKRVTHIAGHAQRNVAVRSTVSSPEGDGRVGA